MDRQTDSYVLNSMSHLNICDTESEDLPVMGILHLFVC